MASTNVVTDIESKNKATRHFNFSGIVFLVAVVGLSFIFKDYVKQREEERENTVIINQKGTTEVLITSGVRFFKGIITIIVFILAAIGLSTLIYPDIRAAFMIEFNHVLDVLKSVL